MKKVIILLISFYGVCANAQSYILDQVVAQVGSKYIKQSDIEDRYQNLRRQGFSEYGDMKCMIFEQLLTEKLLINQAEVDSLVVEPSEVEMALERNFDHLQRRGFTQEDFEKQYNKSIYEIKDDLRKMFYDQKLAEKMQQKITENIKITPSEVRSFYNRLPKDSIPLINLQVEVAHIVMYPPYSDEAISEVRQKLLDLRKRIIDGDRFTTLAAVYSEDPSSVQNGGELGFMSKGGDGLDPEFAKAAWALKNKGDVSRIVESKYGYHIIQLIDRRGDQVNCRHILLTPKPNPEAIATVTGRLDTLVRLIRKDSLNWNVAAFRFSHDDKTRYNGGLMINSDSQSPLFQSTLFETTQFEKVDYEVIKGLKIGEVSDPYESKDEKGRIVYKIVKLKNQTNAHRANLKEDYNFLQELALGEKMNKVIKEWVDEKIENSYIFIEESLKRCGLSNVNWVKQ